jgi:hypothetical protein
MAAPDALGETNDPTIRALAGLLAHAGEVAIYATRREEA